MLDQVIVAFEREQNCWRVREMIESGGIAACIVCRSAAEVKRVVNQQHIAAVVCGYKFPDQSAEALFHDLPPSCAMLMMANQGLLDLCGGDGIFKLPTPASKSDLLASVRMLTELGRWPEQDVRPRRSRREQAAVAQAKAVLMNRHGMTEEQAHRFLQKRSMDDGVKLVQTAQMVLEGL